MGRERGEPNLPRDGRTESLKAGQCLDSTSTITRGSIREFWEKRVSRQLVRRPTLMTQVSCTVKTVNAAAKVWRSCVLKHGPA